MLFISSPIPYHFLNKCYFLMLFLSTVVMAPLQLLDSFCSVTSFEPRSGLYSLLQGYLLPSPGHKNQPTEPAAGFWQWWRMLVHWIKVVVAQPLSSTLHGHMVATKASKVSKGVCCGMGCTTLKAVSYRDPAPLRCLSLPQVCWVSPAIRRPFNFTRTSWRQTGWRSVWRHTLGQSRGKGPVVNPLDQSEPL